MFPPDRRGQGNVNFEEFAKAYTHVVTAATQGGGGARVLGGERGERERERERGGSRYPARQDRGQDEVAETNRTNRTNSTNRTNRTNREDGMTTAEMRDFQEKIVAGKRASQALARKEELEIARLFNDDPGLAVTARACFDR